MLSIANCLEMASALASASDTPRLDTEILLSYVLKKDRAYLYTWPEKTLSQQQYQTFLDHLKQRQEGQPIAYILGEKEFWSLPLSVNTASLIPRPETELLVEVALDLCESEKPASKTILDLGTGSGAIALALASEKPGWQLVAVDKSEDAVNLAKKNQQALGIQNIEIFCSDWFEKIISKQFEIIVSNPPYIHPQDPHLSTGDVRYEPRMALVSANQGLRDIEVIITNAMDYLVDGGWLIFEHGYQQAEAVSELLKHYGYQACFMRKDLSGNPRVSGGRKSS
jgi:release factor glutamine methyltransferase